MKLRFVRAASATSIPSPRITGDPMIIPTVTPLGSEPTAHPPQAHCGHIRHVGTCPTCQRVAQRRSEMQLAAALAARETWATRGLPARAA
jgi:hypothetical protein